MDRLLLWEGDNPVKVLTNNQTLTIRVAFLDSKISFSKPIAKTMRKVPESYSSESVVSSAMAGRGLCRRWGTQGQVEVQLSQGVATDQARSGRSWRNIEQEKPRVVCGKVSHSKRNVLQQEGCLYIVAQDNRAVLLIVWQA
ncbi:unnamed protein product [Choristocarpus tenellus]